MYSVGNVFRQFAGVIITIFLLTGPVTIAHAQSSPSPKVAAFLTDPEQFLIRFPNGGSLLATEVQQLVLLDPSSFSVLLGLLPKANDAQKGGIGEGLAQAAKILVLTNQALAQEWQQQIVAIDDASFKAAATNAFGDVQIGVVGPSPLGGLGGGPTGPGAPRGSSSLEEIRSSPVATSTFTITSSTSAGPSLTFTGTTSEPNPRSSTSP